MKQKYLVPIIVWSLLGCKGHAQKAVEDVPAVFQTMLDDAVADPSLQLAGVSMTVMAPDLAISWTGAAGYDSMQKDQVLAANQPFRIASITKSFVATATLRLHEMDKLSIDEPISKYISKVHAELLEADGYDPDSITIRQCLLHRSGLYDYAMGGDDFVQAAMQDPDKRWTRTEQVQFAMDHGDPLGKPGEVYSYSDTGYILLGEIIEVVTAKPLADALSSLLNYKGLGMNSTWLESLEEPPAGLPAPVHRYMETMDATQWDNSIDLYGGGGIASTTRDLSIFFSALFNGKVFDKPETLDLMLADAGEIPNGRGPANYRLGVWQIEVFDTVGYMHNGFWGTALAHVPDYNFTIAVNYTNDISGAGLMRQTSTWIKRLMEQKR